MEIVYIKEVQVEEWKIILDEMLRYISRFRTAHRNTIAVLPIKPTKAVLYIGYSRLKKIAEAQTQMLLTNLHRDDFMRFSEIVLEYSPYDIRIIKHRSMSREISWDYVHNIANPEYFESLSKTLNFIMSKQASKPGPIEGAAQNSSKHPLAPTWGVYKSGKLASGKRR